MATVEQTNTQSQAKETNSEAVKEGLDEKCSEEFKENECKEEGGNEDQKKESTTTPADITQTKENILTQVEYYFGNKNLRTDTFLNREMKKDPNGWVSLDVLATFNKMKVYPDRDLVVDALRQSPELLEVNEDGTKVRRKLPTLLPIPEQVKRGPMFKSIYAKGFSTETPDVKEITAFFEKYGKVKSVKLRKDENGKFKGSVFVEFQTTDEARKACAMQLSYEDQPLAMMLKFDYCENKCIEKGIDPNTLRTDFGASKESRKPDRGQGRNARKPERDYRCLFKITGAKPDSEWSPIRSEAEKYGTVFWVELYGDGTGYIEYKQPLDEEKKEALLSSDVVIDGEKLSFTTTSPEEATEYFTKKKETSQRLREQKRAENKRSERLDRPPVVVPASKKRKVDTK
ncbi:8950_t:CDS:2 [Paraglomus brasilianum]|uniref:8950_t:CDS:1 n=1 Tax=Paraglomus brasilianum TaxID=144538 RepID=A0A9N9CN49_9GLOM|nr:8950_t:CDS:2 [Paraglomus brasilianum]